MKYLLDTCVLSELTKPEPSARVVAWLRAREQGELALSALTLGELEKGVQRLPAGKKKRALRSWLDELSQAYADRILDLTASVAVHWGRVAARAETAGEPIPVIDALIGSTAIVAGLTVVTRNTTDIARTGAEILDLWT